MRSRMPAKTKAFSRDSTANLGFEAKLRAGKADYAKADAGDRDEPSGENQVQQDSLQEVQPTGAGEAARGKQTAAGSRQNKLGSVHHFGVPPKGNANFAWEQHFIHHLPLQDMAGVDFVCLRCAPAVLAHGSMSSNQSGEGDIRRALIEADLVDCMVALPGQLFYSTQIPVCLWFLAKDKRDAKDKKDRVRGDRRGHTLFIDARKMGTLIDRVHRELTDADLQKIVQTYHAWRGDQSLSSLGSLQSLPAYADLPGFCKSATTAEIAAHGHVLTPGRYVGAEEVEDDGDPFEEKMPRLVAEWHAQFAESAKLEQAIKANLRGLGYGG
jgi:type I restriction enzyme M protein